MAKPNYSFEKHQRELAKKRKKEAKTRRKLAKDGTLDPAAVGSSRDASTPADAGTSTGNT